LKVGFASALDAVKKCDEAVGEKIVLRQRLSRGIRHAVPRLEHHINHVVTGSWAEERRLYWTAIKDRTVAAAG
jgi:hypothetical protein